jgi:hypothetical protein
VSKFLDFVDIRRADIVRSPHPRGQGFELLDLELGKLSGVVVPLLLFHPNGEQVFLDFLRCRLCFVAAAAAAYFVAPEAAVASVAVVANLFHVFDVVVFWASFVVVYVWKERHFRPTGGFFSSV